MRIFPCLCSAKLTFIIILLLYTTWWSILLFCAKTNKTPVFTTVQFLLMPWRFVRFLIEKIAYPILQDRLDWVTGAAAVSAGFATYLSAYPHTLRRMLLTVDWPQCLAERGIPLVFDSTDPVKGHVIEFMLDVNGERLAFVPVFLQLYNVHKRKCTNKCSTQSLPSRVTKCVRVDLSSGNVSKAAMSNPRPSRRFCAAQFRFSLW